MDLLNETEVNTECPQLRPFDLDDDDDELDEEEGGDEDSDEGEGDDLAVIDDTQFEVKKKRAGNYSEVEDCLLVRAWAQVGLDAVTGTDQTGKRYWQRIEDAYCRLKPRSSTLGYRSFRSLQGRWDVIKPACARWSAAMDQIRNDPPSSIVESDYVSSHISWLEVVIVLFFIYHVLCFCRRNMPTCDTKTWPGPTKEAFHLSIALHCSKTLTSGS